MCNMHRGQGTNEIVLCPQFGRNCLLLGIMTCMIIELNMVLQTTLVRCFSLGHNNNTAIILIIQIVNLCLSTQCFQLLSVLAYSKAAYRGGLNNVEHPTKSLSSTIERNHGLKFLFIILNTNHQFKYCVFRIFGTDAERSRKTGQILYREYKKYSRNCCQRTVTGTVQNSGKGGTIDSIIYSTCLYLF